MNIADNFHRPPTAGISNAFNFAFTGAHRAKTANLPSTVNPRIKRYEEVILRLKRLLGQEKRTLRRVRTVCSREIEVKGALEKILRGCVDDVKNEIAKKRAQAFNKQQNAYYAKSKREIGADSFDDKTLTQQEREKIIEVLLSQERVLTLLYDKTFPPRPATTGNPAAGLNR
jgi:hypothetical protein